MAYRLVLQRSVSISISLPAFPPRKRDTHRKGRQIRVQHKRPNQVTPKDQDHRDQHRQVIHPILDRHDGCRGKHHAHEREERNQHLLPEALEDFGQLFEEVGLFDGFRGGGPAHIDPERVGDEGGGDGDGEAGEEDGEEQSWCVSYKAGSSQAEWVMKRTYAGQRAA